MPFYDYKCNRGHTFESMCSMADRKEPKECPECGKKAKRIFSVNKVNPTFGYKSTIWNQREKHRKKHMIPNQSYTG